VRAKALKVLTRILKSEYLGIADDKKLYIEILKSTISKLKDQTTATRKQALRLFS
jgi:hypothetical protein